ncbi:G-type lectin S-receptor-like serine/threonine-protein kinase At4g27290 [Camellia sinensis]|uniref:G-type lectin S-receptor-like serine/threonine-protein kinase At4g27290 n=1 Tax=Camellia sinensis TaxID=4442 RepID=UPI0010362830|nr:G-type lectin S-receptor-like serine/threonine-protein kinase At4g27290 [Camellia sinensis]
MSTEKSERHEPIEPNEPNAPVELRSSKRDRIEKSFGPDFIVYLIERTRKAYCKQTMISLNMDSDPLAFEEAMKSQDVTFWKEAINDEMESIMGSHTIVSSGGSFEMGFFSPGNPQNQYLGIWYKKISSRTVVWVANREIPLIDSSSVLKVIDPGILALLNGISNVIWSANVTRCTVQDPIGQLLESGNLVVRDANDDNLEHFLWQSFDHPCDTLLPSMKLGKNFVSGLERHLLSWKSSDDPSQGDFAFRCDPKGYLQLILSNGSIQLFQTGPWNGLGFSGTPSLKPNSIYTYGLVFTKEEAYFSHNLVSSSVVSRCNVGNSPRCGCLSKFVPRNQTEWGNGDYSNGCVRRTPLDFHNGDGFLKCSRYKMPDTQNSWFDRSMTLMECETVCLKNCSCMAYTNLDMRGGGSGCLLWFDELIDMREFSENGQDIYIRMASLS